MTAWLCMRFLLLVEMLELVDTWYCMIDMTVLHIPFRTVVSMRLLKILAKTWSPTQCSVLAAEELSELGLAIGPDRRLLQLTTVFSEFSIQQPKAISSHIFKDKKGQEAHTFPSGTQAGPLRTCLPLERCRCGMGLCLPPRLPLRRCRSWAAVVLP